VALRQGQTMSPYGKQTELPCPHRPWVPVQQAILSAEPPAWVAMPRKMSAHDKLQKEGKCSVHHDPTKDLQRSTQPQHSPRKITLLS
jgi:hypothetical protein